MKNKGLIEKFKKRARQNALLRKDVRFIKAIALLKAKGLLRTNLPIAPMATLRLHVDDVLWAGKNVEPRILEVLPAALLHFPKNFAGTENLPDDLEQVLKAIRCNADDGPDFGGLPFQKMKFWANVKMKDRRTKPEKEKRQLKAFRLHPKTLAKLERLVTEGGFKDQTSAIEAAIAKL